MHRSLRLLIACLLGVGVHGCGEGAKRTSPNVFYYNEFEDLNSLDPARINNRAAWWVGNQVYVGLVTLDSAMNPVPQLARSWDVSEDGRTWTFHLRADVRFCDDPCFAGGKGRPVTAEDVRFSFQRICDPSTASTGFWVFRGKIKGAEEFFEKHKQGDAQAPDAVTGLRVLDDSTFQMELEQPFAPILPLLSIPYCYIVPAEAIARYGAEYLRHPVGAGAFRLAEWTQGQRIVLVRNRNYYERDPSGGSLPYLDSVVVTFVKDKKSEFSEYEAGRLDAISTIEPTLLDRIFDGQGRLTDLFKGHGLHQVPSMSIEYYGFMLDSSTTGGKGSPFVGNRYLRRALNYAVDREAIARYVLRGQGVAAVHGPIPPGTPGFSGVKGYAFDRELARKLLDSAGFPNGRGLSELTLQISEGARNLAVGQAVQEQLKAIGVAVRIVQVAPPQHREMVATGKLPFWRANWMADYPDGENFLILFFSRYASPSGSNTTHFSNSRVDELYHMGLDPRLTRSERTALYAEAERIILDQAPWILLYHSKVQRLTRPGISGYRVDPLDRLMLTYVRKTQTNS